ncbi:putative RNA polymerase II subunit B1 CTD phosphatase RPAP2 homolog [Salvia splendens]|uniref:putative RNA polymerase II subunit B1 CTD phosphatase RPAP2 homolog n=1 Tax=Salvia splendens TaxID=180675 RepID=UPI001C255664|nr:putative RNA polymerase II subunit B1 CTD phosphatase RPAP2 homolog [Salvia splendens]
MKLEKIKPREAFLLGDWELVVFLGDLELVMLLGFSCSWPCSTVSNSECFLLGIGGISVEEKLKVWEDRNKDAVHKLQLFLLDGIKDENHLLAAGSLISRGDYNDVVTERTIAEMCGYPLCTNPLPSDRPHKGRYRISLKEHKVYDLQETYMYCSSTCLINSRAFTANLQEERSSDLNPAKLSRIVKLFEESNSDTTVDMGKNGDLGISELKIQEKTGREAGNLSMEEWIGPSNAIDGYVPRSNKNLESLQLNNNRKAAKKGKGPKHRLSDPNVQDIMSFDMNFTSTIITQDEYSVSKAAPSLKAKESRGKLSAKSVNCESKPMQNPAASLTDKNEVQPKKSDISMGSTGVDDNVDAPEDISSACQSDDTRATVLRSSIKTSDSKKSVRWADEKTDFDGQNLEEYQEFKEEKTDLVTPHSAVEEVGEEELYRFSSAEACAEALSRAAEAVASGKSDASDAVSEAGVIILPPPHGVDTANSEENADIKTGLIQLKWPLKPGVLSSDLFDSEDSWYDSPPDGFNLQLSTFSTMFMALFSWISSSSLAYIYGKEESFHEEYLSVNGREYPHKILSDGRSAEIKHTLAGCLARALPTLVTELRLPVPVSTLEQGLGRLLDTMSFTDPIPAFRMKQWHVIVLLFLDALSVSRIPSLTQYMLSRRVVIPKVLEGAQIGSEEFEIMKDLVIPLGRAPQFSTQSGG